MAEVIVYYPDRYGESDPEMVEGLTIGKLVRRKECKHYKNCEVNDLLLNHENGYCSDGEKRTD